MGTVLAMKRSTIWTLSGLIALLAGCGSYQRNESSVLDYVRGAVQSLQGADAGKAPPVTRAELAKIPGPLLQAEIESRDTFARLSFLADNGPYRTWASADNATITQRDGVLVATRALGNDLMSADVVQILRMLKDATVPEGVRVHRYLDGEGRLYTRVYQCVITDRRAVPLDILGDVVPMTRLSESCRGEGDQFENTYWRDRDGRIRATRQWVSPDIGYLGTVLLKG